MEAVDKEVELSIVSRVSLNIPENAYLIGMVGRISRQRLLMFYTRCCCFEEYSS